MGYGEGYGEGYGDGYGEGYGDGYGEGCGDGYGEGYGDGYGEGYGDGYGEGYGDGYGDGYPPPGYPTDASFLPVKRMTKEMSLNHHYCHQDYNLTFERERRLDAQPRFFCSA